MNVFFRTRLFPAPCSQQSEHLIRRLHPDADRLLRARQIAEIADAHPAAPVLVFVGGTNAAAGRADLVFLFPGAIEQLVIRQREVRAVGNVQLVLGTDAPRRQRIELGEQLLGIELHAVADDADRALEDPRGNLMQHEGLALARVHRMPRVRAPLVAHYQISALGQDVDDLAFAFIAPLSANHDDALCLWSEHGVVLAGNKKGPDWGARLCSILCGKLCRAEYARQSRGDTRGAVQPDPIRAVRRAMHEQHGAPISLENRDTLARDPRQGNAIHDHRQPAPWPCVKCLRYGGTVFSGSM